MKTKILYVNKKLEEMALNIREDIVIDSFSVLMLDYLLELIVYCGEYEEIEFIVRTFNKFTPCSFDSVERFPALWNKYQEIECVLMEFRNTEFDSSPKTIETHRFEAFKELASKLQSDVVYSDD